MAAYIWTDNTSGNTLWNDQLNWNDGISGYPNGNDDSALFDGTWTSNCTANEALTVGLVLVDENYTGTITQSQNITVDDTTLDGDFTITEGTWSQSTLNLLVDRNFVNNDTHVMGASAGTGLTAGSIEFRTGSFRDWQTTTKIVCNGDFVEPASDVSVTNNTGDLILAGNGNLTKGSVTNYLYGFTINAGVTTTATGAVCRITNKNSGKVILNGILNTGSGPAWCTMGCKAIGSFILGAAGDIVGSGDISLEILYGATVTDNKGSALSHTGSIGINGISNDSIIPSWHFSNSLIMNVGSYASGDATRYFSPGTLKIKGFVIKSSAGRTNTIKADTNNPSYEFSGNVDLNDGTGTVVWYRGTNAITLTNTVTKTFAGDGLTIEAINKTGAGITEFSENCSPLSVSGSAGTIRSDAAGTQRTLTVTNTGVCTGMTIKDISFGAKDMVNAKSGCTNNGNNKGIIFRDRPINVMM